MQKAATQATPIPMLLSTAPLDTGDARVGPIVRRGPAVVSPIHTSPRRTQTPVLIQRGPASPAESTSSASSNETCRYLYFSRESNASTSSSPAPWSSPTTSPCSPAPTISPARTSQPKTRKRSAQDTLRRINVAHGKRLNALAKQSFDMLKPSSHPPVVRRKRSSSGTWRLSGAARIERVAEGMSKPVGNPKMDSVDIEEWWANLDEELKQRSPPEAELQHPRPKRLFQRAELQDIDHARDTQGVENESVRITLKKESTASPLGLARHGSSPLRKVAMLP